MSTVLEEITPDPTLPDQLNIAPTTKFKIPMMWLSASLAAHMPSLTLTIYRDDIIFVGSIYISPFKLSSWISPTSHALNRAASQTGTTSRVSKTQNLIDSSLSPPDGAPSTISYSLVFVPEILFDQASLLPHGGVKTSDELRPVVLTVFVVASCGFNLPEGCTRPGIMGRIGRRGKVKKDWGWWCCRQDANDTAAHDKNINESDGKDNYDNDVTNDYYYNKTFSHVVPFHVARRSFLELVAVDENENSPFARARVPVWSLVEGQGRWVDMKGIEKQVTGDGEGDNIQFESLLDAGKKENGLDSSGDEGSCWVAVGIKFEEEATPVAPTMRMTQTQTSTTAKKMTTTTTTTTTTMPSPPAEDIKDIKIPQATIPEGPKIQAPPSDTSPIVTTPGTLHVLVHEALHLPPKNSRVGLLCVIKPSKSSIKKEFTRPCLLGRRGTHPIWGEHLSVDFELQEKHGESLKIQILDVKNSNASKRLVGFTTLPNTDIVSGCPKEHILSLELIDDYVSEPLSVDSPQIKISTFFSAANNSNEDNDADDLAAFKKLGLNRKTLVQPSSFLAEEPILPPPPLVANFSDSEEARLFSHYASDESSSFLTREQFLNFCRDKFQLGSTSTYLESCELDEYVAIANRDEESSQNLTGITEVLAKNEAVKIICELLVSEFEENRMFDVSLSSFIRFLRINNSTEANIEGNELASEAMALERTSHNLSAVAQQINALKSSIADAKSKRIVGFTADEREERLTPHFMISPKFWKKHVKRLKTDFENLFNRFAALEDIEFDTETENLSYDDLIDGLVVDEGILRSEMADMEASFRNVSDYMFETLHESPFVGNNSIASILELKRKRCQSEVEVEENDEADDNNDDDNVTYKLYEHLLTTLRNFKKLRNQSNKLGLDIIGLYERAKVERGQELYDKQSRESDAANCTKLSIVKKIINVCEKAHVDAKNETKTATWGAPPPSQGRKKNIDKTGPKLYLTSSKKSSSSGGDDDSPQYVLERRARLEDISNELTMNNISYNEVAVRAIIKESEDGKPWAASFSYPLDSYSLKLFSTNSIFDEEVFQSSQEIDATNGLDSLYEAKKLSEVLFESSKGASKGVDALIVEACMSTMVSIVEGENINVQRGRKRKNGDENRCGGGGGYSDGKNEEKKEENVQRARRRLSLDTWESIEAAAVATVVGPHYSSAAKLMDSVRRLSVSKVAASIVSNQQGNLPAKLKYDFDKTLVTNLTSVVSGMNEDKAQNLVESLLTDVEIFKPANMIVLIYVFAGVVENSDITVDTIIDCMKMREKNLKRKASLDDDLVANDLAYMRTSSEFRSGVYNNSSVDEIKHMAEARAEYEREKREHEEKLATYPHLHDVPSELNALFAVAESEEWGADESGDMEKKKALSRILNDDFTLERAKFKHGLTAMHIAAYKNNYLMVKILIERGNSITEADVYNKLPQDYTRDSMTLEALGLLSKGDNKHCELRSTLQRRIMQNVNFLVRSNDLGEGVASQYDMFNKKLYVSFPQNANNDNDNDNNNTDSGPLVLDIFGLKMVKCAESCSLPQQKLFDDIKECVNAFRREEAKKLAKVISRNVIIVANDHVLDFISTFQAEAYAEIEKEVIGEISSKEASEDMAEAQRELERQQEEIRLARVAEEKRREEERQRALRFKATVKGYSEKFVEPIISKCTPWIATLLYHFNKFDVDGNGTLSAMETVAALRTMGITKKVQENSPEIQQLITRFRRLTGELTLKQFIFDLPDEVYDAIKRSVTRGVGGGGSAEMEKSKSKRNVRFSLGTAVDITTSSKGEVKKVRRRQVKRDLPPTPEMESKNVMRTMIREVIRREKESRALSNVFEGDVDVVLENMGEDAEVVRGKIRCNVGAEKSTVFVFRGNEVLEEQRMTVDDDDSMVRFEKALEGFGMEFDDLLDDFDGFMNVDDPTSVLEGCVLGLLQRKGWSGREAYLEVKGSLRNALLVPLAFNTLMVSFTGGEISEVICDDIVIDDFARLWYDDKIGENVEDGVDMRKYRKFDNSFGAKIIVCRLMKIPAEATRLLSGLVDVGHVVENMLDIVNSEEGGFLHKGVNRLTKKRSKMTLNSIITRFTILEEEDGMITSCKITGEGKNDYSNTIRNLKHLPRDESLDESFEEEEHARKLQEIKQKQEIEMAKIANIQKAKDEVEQKNLQINEEYEREKLVSPIKTLLIKKGNITEDDLERKRLELLQLKAKISSSNSSNSSNSSGNGSASDGSNKKKGVVVGEKKEVGGGNENGVGDGDGVGVVRGKEGEKPLTEENKEASNSNSNSNSNSDGKTKSKPLQPITNNENIDTKTETTTKIAPITTITTITTPSPQKQVQ